MCEVTCRLLRADACYGQTRARPSRKDPESQGDRAQSRLSLPGSGSQAWTCWSSPPPADPVPPQSPHNQSFHVSCSAFRVRRACSLYPPSHPDPLSEEREPRLARLTPLPVSCWGPCHALGSWLTHCPLGPGADPHSHVSWSCTPTCMGWPRGVTWQGGWLGKEG